MNMRRALSALPEIEPPTDLQSRIEAGWLAQRRRRKQRKAWLGVCTVVLAVAAAAPAFRPDRVPAPGNVDVAAIRAIDRELQLAYSTGSDADRIETLWLARRALLEGSGSQPAAMTPIHL